MCLSVNKHQLFLSVPVVELLSDVQLFWGGF